MNTLKNTILLLLLFSSANVYPSNWRALAAVSVVSSYLGCSYFEKKENWHSKRFWKNVTGGASVSFISGCFLEWLLSSKADDNKQIHFAQASDHAFVCDSTNSGSSQLAISETNIICGMTNAEIATMAVQFTTALIIAYLTHIWQERNEEKQRAAAREMQNEEHRFQIELVKMQQAEARAHQKREHCFQVSERHESEAFMRAENSKNRVAAEKDTKSDERFMNQFRIDASALRDCSSLGYVSEPLQQWLSDINNGCFNDQHLLLSGYAGSGKSHTIRVVANEIKKQCEALGKKVHVFMLQQARLFRVYNRETTIEIERFFRCANNYAKEGAEVIILWDEINLLTSGCSSTDSAAHDINSVVEALKDIIDSNNLSKHVRILATTNHPDKINDAIKSRFKGTCELKLPTRAEREKLFGFWLKNAQCKDHKIWKHYAQKTEGWSLRDLQKFFGHAKKLSKNFFDKKSLSIAFAEVSRAKKAGKQDFSEHLSRREKVKKAVMQGVYWTGAAIGYFLNGVAGGIGSFVVSCLAGR